MNIEDVYFDFPELRTREEKEDDDYRSSDYPDFPSPPEWFSNHRTDIEYLTSGAPDEYGRQDFEKRKPGLGLSLAQIDALEEHARDPRIRPVQLRALFQMLKHDMLRRLISTNNLTTVPELLQVLREEVRSGIPAPLPEWYVFSKVTHGPRRMGYYPCSRRGCHKTETLQASFPQCSKCKLAHYCSRECQAADWKERHKKVCKTAAKQRQQLLDAGQFQQMFM